MVRQPYAAKERAVGVDLVVFDWDGTLIDSTTRIAESLHRAAQDTGPPLLSLGRYRSIIGLGLPEALHSLYPDADEQTRHVLRGHYAAHYIAATEADPCLPYDGAVELLENLRDRGIRLAVATGKIVRDLSAHLPIRGWPNSLSHRARRMKLRPSLIHACCWNCCVSKACCRNGRSWWVIPVLIWKWRAVRVCLLSVLPTARTTPTS
jgi:hypothetical protein